MNQPLTAVSNLVTEDVSGNLSVAFVSEVEELDAGPPSEPYSSLNEVIDMDVLAQLVAESQQSIRTTFDHLDCEVTVTSGAAADETFAGPN